MPNNPNVFRYVPPPVPRGYREFPVADTNLGQVTVEKESLKDILKKRHLSKSERQFLHKPLPDWELQSGKEICKSTCSLVVDDLV